MLQCPCNFESILLSIYVVLTARAQPHNLATSLCLLTTTDTLPESDMANSTSCRGMNFNVDG
jgi:hypothetical protein